jgi:L,D-peptidoglycan transpeptidase YkuD (ErfK/YbiS/YcfS/YnhG family)
MKKYILLLLAALWTLSGVASSNPSDDVLTLAKKEYQANKAKLDNKRYITIIDYSKSILQTRLYVYDTKTGDVVLSSRVSHAWNSGVLYATDFSNTNGSEKTCTGSFITGESYSGKFGFSMRVRGITKGINENAMSRAIVFHEGYTYTLGCFATPPDTNRTLIGMIKGGSLVYVHRP